MQIVIKSSILNYAYAKEYICRGINVMVNMIVKNKINKYCKNK